MNCPKCGKSNISNAKFCMHCGETLSAPAPVQTPQSTVVNPATMSTGYAAPAYQMQPAVRSKKSSAMAIAAGLIVLAAAVLGISKYMRDSTKLTSKPPQAPNALNLNNRPLGGPSVISANGNPAAGPNVLNTTGKTNPLQKPPQDVVDWLNHLKNVELQRQAFGQQMQSELTNMAANGAVSQIQEMLNSDDLTKFEPGKKFQADTENIIIKIQAKFQELIKQLDSKPVPAVCRPLHDNYWNVLFEYPKDAVGLLQAIEKKDLGAAKAEKQNRPKLSQRIGVCNTQLQGLGNQYNIPIDFSIEQEESNSGMGGMFGLGY